MKRLNNYELSLLILLTFALSSAAVAQEAVILSGEELAKLLPANFYFDGQLAPTQTRNAAAVRFDNKRHVVASLVETSGYATSIREKFEGFLISDARISVGSAQLVPGAYGFGFTKDGKMNIFDLGENQLASIPASQDAKLKSPRPLAIVKNGNEIRLYRGRDFVVIGIK